MLENNHTGRICLIIFFLIAFVINACHPDKNAEVSAEEIDFKITDSSELFFKNVRKSEYTVEERKEAGLELYSRSDLLIQNQFKPIIIINWRTDRAFFYLQQEENSEATFTIQIAGEPVIFNAQNQQNHAEISRLIYNAILNEKEVMMNNELFFESAKQINDFRRMFFDYLRLVDIR